MMKFFRKIFGFDSKFDFQIKNWDDLIAQSNIIGNQIHDLVNHKLPKFMDHWSTWTDGPLNLDEKEMKTALESCFWAVAFIHLVRDAENCQWPGEWVVDLLENIQKIKDEEDSGCRIRYSRGMLQEYAESGRKYRNEEKVLYFGEWLWNCNAKNASLQGDVRIIRTVGQQFYEGADVLNWN